MRKSIVITRQLLVLSAVIVAYLIPPIIPIDASFFPKENFESISLRKPFSADYSKIAETIRLAQTFGNNRKYSTSGEVRREKAEKLPCAADEKQCLKSYECNTCFWEYVTLLGSTNLEPEVKDGDCDSLLSWMEKLKETPTCDSLTTGKEAFCSLAECYLASYSQEEYECENQETACFLQDEECAGCFFELLFIPELDESVVESIVESIVDCSSLLDFIEATGLAPTCDAFDAKSKDLFCSLVDCNLKGKDDEIDTDCNAEESACDANTECYMCLDGLDDVPEPDESVVDCPTALAFIEKSELAPMCDSLEKESEDLFCDWIDCIFEVDSSKGSKKSKKKTKKSEMSKSSKPSKRSKSSGSSKRSKSSKSSGSSKRSKSSKSSKRSKSSKSSKRSKSSESSKRSKSSRSSKSSKSDSKSTKSSKSKPRSTKSSKSK